MLNKSLFSSDSGEWETPQTLIDQLRQEFNFTLDVCATGQNFKANGYFTKSTDGLAHSWRKYDRGGVCWMNPPYGRGVGEWVFKAFTESLQGCVVVCLLPARTDTQWFQDWVLGKAELRFIRGRLKFEGAASSAPFPSILAIYRPWVRGYIVGQ